MQLRIATRGSALARWQARHVATLLDGHHTSVDVDVETVVVSTVGDRDRTSPLSEIGGKGVFVKEVQQAVLDGRADVAVHSAKDLPAVTPADLVIAAVPERGDARDALVGAALDELRPGARVATGSPRRRAQLAWLRPDLTFAELRGNIETRIARADDHDAVVVAAVALERLGLDDSALHPLAVQTFVPQVGQGALAVECRADDHDTRAMLAAIEHVDSRRAVDAERGFLGRLGGDCDLPAGAHAEVRVDGTVAVDGFVADLAGQVLLRHVDCGADGPAVGAEVARHLLEDAGGADLQLV